jgi:kynurenine formamidase
MGVMLYQSAEQVEGPLNIRQSKRLNRREVVGGLALAGAASLFGLGPKGAGAESTRRQNISFENIVDLTHTLTSEFPYIPVPGITFAFNKVPIATMEKQGVAANRWEIHEHIGTQIDAPSHFLAGGMSLDQIPVTNLIASLAVIDIRQRAGGDADTMVTVDDIEAWEKRYGRLPQGAAVFMNSGWEARVNDPTAFVNMDSSSMMHFPGFAAETAAFLARERQVVGIGVDTLSLDAGRDKEYKAHKVWLGAGKWGVECVANLHQVPPSGAIVFVGGVKVDGATGGPVRLIAIFPSAARRRERSPR